MGLFSACQPVDNCIIQTQDICVTGGLPRAIMRFTMFRVTSCLLPALVFASAYTQAAEPVSFARQIAPLLARRCLVCHSARVAEGRVDLENYAAVLRGGAKGKTVVPGAALESHLYLALADGRMPQNSEPFQATELALVRN